jgi:molecular chaperone GrpE
VTDDADVREHTDRVLAAVTEMRASLADLAGQVARNHEHARARERVIDRLHEEASELKKGQSRELLRPVVTDLRRLRDDLMTQARSVAETMSRDQVAVLLESYADSVVLILERCGVVPVRPALETPFDPRQHQVSGVTETARRQLDGTIAGIVHDGYTEAGTGQQIAPARVNVYRYADGVDQASAPG